jgi:hypothetical protein
MKKSLILILLVLVTALPFTNMQAKANEDGYKKIVGRWIRADGGYVLDIKNVKENGEIDAAYLNPRSINIAKAQASIEKGKINVFVELKDKMYPGSYYTLVYDSPTDRLMGVYHHLGINQNFNVHFVRQE